jgi:hypothetical protein
MSVTITDDRKMWDLFQKQIKELDGRGTSVGFQGTSSEEEYEDNDVTVLEVAVTHEFGTEDIPARPFLRETISREAKKIEERIAKELKQVAMGKQGWRKAYNRIGAFAASKIKNTIRRSKSWAEPLQQKTIDRKGSSTPLIDSSQLLQSVSWALVDKGKVEKEQLDDADT